MLDLRSALPRLASLLLIVVSTLHSNAQESTLVPFDRDVWPILESKCLECHGPDDAKNDFRVDQADLFMDYVEAGAATDSSLWTDYLVTDDEELQMPPPSKPQLTGPELATIKLWIDEGATWVDPTSDSEETAPEPAIPESTAAKYWSLSGLFHPALIHFPVALLAVSAGFCILSFFNKDAFEPVAFHCLWIGALGAVAACCTGWAYAEHEGYGAAQFSAEHAIDRHRWLGICVAVGSLILIPIARSVKKSSDAGMRFFWALGAVAIMLGVSTTGYQGGELTYGEDHYLKEYQRLFPENAPLINGGAAETETVETASEKPENEASTAADDSPEKNETDASDDSSAADDSDP